VETSVRTRLAAFAVLLAVVFGGAAVVGNAVPTVHEDEPEVEHGGTGTHTPEGAE